VNSSYKFVRNIVESGVALKIKVHLPCILFVIADTKKAFIRMTGSGLT
jgi:hypothetical protein